MKVLLLNTYDSGGGAAIAAKRLLDALRMNNVNAVLGVLEKKINDDSVFMLKRKKKAKNSLKAKILGRLKRYSTRVSSVFAKEQFETSNPVQHSLNNETLIDIEQINASDYDLVHLHWINDNMISIEDIVKIKKNLVWTMHDTWVFCGAEHYPNVLENDIRFIEGYTETNKPETTRGKDICRETWERKVKAWKNLSAYFISPSNFEKELFEKSKLFCNFPNLCTVIHNVFSKNIFRPIDADVLKKIYHIPLGKKIIGFGAAYGISDRKSIKGGYLLLDTLKKIKVSSDYHFVIFGNASASFINELETPTFTTGFISNPYILAGIYNLCDVFVCPSLLENLPSVCVESLFCGIPVAAFNTGGIPDIIEHKKTGYLAKCFDTDDLLNGILYCIENKNELSENSLIKAKREFDNDEITKSHIELYKSIIAKNDDSKENGESHLK